MNIDTCGDNEKEPAVGTAQHRHRLNRDVVVENQTWIGTKLCMSLVHRNNLCISNSITPTELFDVMVK